MAVHEWLVEKLLLIREIPFRERPGSERQRSTTWCRSDLQRTKKKGDQRPRTGLSASECKSKTDTETNSVVTMGFTTKVDHQTTSKIWYSFHGNSGDFIGLEEKKRKGKEYNFKSLVHHEVDLSFFFLDLPLLTYEITAIAVKIVPDFRSCLMTDLGRETDGNNGICFSVRFGLCRIKALRLARIEY